ncbi:hypothetical protein Scep_020668 [Stephania cephalantha]|uniref:Uncharacterized protein n=1 Tax=Stephania cephalantha TaxID=152367 RepID=A0AAP0ID02_9MAGN
MRSPEALPPATDKHHVRRSDQLTRQPRLPPISEVRLEQMSKAVRWLVIELQQGSGAAGSASHAHPSVPFDARFHEDSGQ